MPKVTTDGEVGNETHEQHQSGMQVWVACALFVLVPALLILAVKYFFGL